MLHNYQTGFSCVHFLLSIVQWPQPLQMVYFGSPGQRARSAVYSLPLSYFEVVA